MRLGPPDGACNCGRRGTRSEGNCIYCREKDQSWRIWQQVIDIMAKALRYSEKLT